MSLIRAAVKHLLGRSVAGRGVTVFPDDVFLVSYPRSGNTWTRFLIGNLIYQDEPVTFANVERRLPDIYLNSQRAMLQLPRPRILKSHEPFDSRYKKTVYIVRDPRDVAVSFYHWKIKRRVLPDGYPMDRFVSQFVVGEFEPTAGSWGENVASWLVTRCGNPGFLLLRYEDMLQDPKRELQKVGSFLDLNMNEERLTRAIQLSSADHMRELEKVQSLKWKCTQNDRQDKPFVRTATAGGWKSELPPVLVAELESAWAEIMCILGYRLVSSPLPQNHSDILGRLLSAPYATAT